MSATITKGELTAAVETVHAIAETVRELGTVSDGTLYAALMGKLNIGQYQAIIAILVKAGLVSNNGHQLRWIGGVPAVCGFSLFDMMPPCVLATGHEGDHTDGFGGFYGRA